MIVKLDTERMSISFELQKSDAESSDYKIAGDIATLISVLSAHQASAFFNTEDSRLCYLFMLISNANKVLEQVNKFEQSMEDDDFDEEDYDIDLDALMDFLKKYLEDSEDGDDLDDEI